MLGVMVNFKRKDTVLAIYVCFLNLYFSQIQVNKILYNTVLISDGNCHKSMYNISTLECILMSSIRVAAG